MLCRNDMIDLIQRNDIHPLMLRLAWADAASFDQTIKEWPRCGGVNGSIRFEKEYDNQINSGLSKAISYITDIKKLHPQVSWSDLIQMGGALAVSLTGGPEISLIYGRVDCKENQCDFKVRVYLYIMCKVSCRM